MQVGFLSIKYTRRYYSLNCKFCVPYNVISKQRKYKIISQYDLDKRNCYSTRIIGLPDLCWTVNCTRLFTCSIVCL